MTALVYDAARSCWLRFSEPVAVVQTSDVNEVFAKLQHVERMVNERQLHAAGFISYEASPVFDPALHVHSDGSFPLLWFGLFETPEPFRLTTSDNSLFTFGEWNPSVRRHEYDDAITRIKSYIQAGDTYQVNYSFRLRSPFWGDAHEFFLHLANAQLSNNGAFIETDDFAICSASPELFFSLDGENITARPMKGTAPRGLTPA
ncbi:MAG: chorismate-binding protein, partial [Bacteroidota bacterium]